VVKLFETWKWLPERVMNVGRFVPGISEGPWSHWISIAAYAALAYSLYHFARKPLETAPPPAPPKADLPGTPDARVEQ
jgi:hypothetical protein